MCVCVWGGGGGGWVISSMKSPVYGGGGYFIYENNLVKSPVYVTWGRGVGILRGSYANQ